MSSGKITRAASKTSGSHTRKKLVWFLPRRAVFICLCQCRLFSSFPGDFIYWDFIFPCLSYPRKTYWLSCVLTVCWLVISWVFLIGLRRNRVNAKNNCAHYFHQSLVIRARTAGNWKSLLNDSILSVYSHHNDMYFFSRYCLLLCHRVWKISSLGLYASIVTVFFFIWSFAKSYRYLNY